MKNNRCIIPKVTTILWIIAVVLSLSSCVDGSSSLRERIHEKKERRSKHKQHRPWEKDKEPAHDTIVYEDPKADDPINDKAAGAEEARAEVPSAETCERVVNQWCEALNEQSYTQIENFYADVSYYYHSYYTHTNIRTSLNTFYQRYTYFHQYVQNIQVTICSSYTRVTFDKYVCTTYHGSYTRYAAYLILVGATNPKIIEESDMTTDANMAKQKQSYVHVDNSTTLEQLFCSANVGKWVKTSYWGLLEYDFEAEAGPIATMIMDQTGMARSTIAGVIQRNFGGQANTYYVGGWANAHGFSRPVIYIYHSDSHATECIGLEDISNEVTYYIE